VTTDLKVIHRALQRLVCPILRANKRGGVEFNGSAVPFTVESTRFLLTAAHVLDDPVHAPYVFGKILEGRTELVDLEGERIETVPPPKGRDYDHVDAAILKLSDEAANAIACNHRFLSPEDLDIGGRSSSQDNYAFIGYPVSKFRLRPGNRAKFAGAMFGLTGATDDKYRQLDLDTSTHILANYNPKTVLVNGKSGQKSGNNPLHPRGISGGGIWTLKTKESDSVGVHEPKLAGVGIRWRPQYEVMVGVRVTVLVALIVAAFPDTRKFFPHFTQLPQIKESD
jgi:hypothetical protein